jgi:hypothetical protein
VGNGATVVTASAGGTGQFVSGATSELAVATMVNGPDGSISVSGYRGLIETVKDPILGDVRAGVVHPNSEWPRLIPMMAGMLAMMVFGAVGVLLAASRKPR